MYRARILVALCLAVFVLIFLLPFKKSDAAMSSGSYKIIFDTVDVGGRNSTSTTFTIEDSLGESATGIGTSTNYTVEAGYQQMYDTYISISTAPPVTLASINGLTGGFSTSSLAWTVLTDNAAGYSLTVQASSTPALQSSVHSTFADYAPAGSAPDFTFTIGAASSSFGFSPKGSDIVARYKDNGSTACNTGSSQTLNACWDGFSTSPTTIAQSTASNQPSGTVTTVTVEAKVGSSKIQDSGTYTATITATAVTL